MFAYCTRFSLSLIFFSKNSCYPLLLRGSATGEDALGLDEGGGGCSEKVGLSVGLLWGGGRKRVGGGGLVVVSTSMVFRGERLDKRKKRFQNYPLFKLLVT